MRVLHITNWYPTPGKPKEAIWIKRQIQALAVHLESFHVLHLEVKVSSRFLFRRYDSPSCTQRVLELPVRTWRIIEMASGVLLVYHLLKLRSYKYDLAMIHIAYPNLTYCRLVRKLLNVPIAISEHWSAYHFSFGVQNSRKLERIKRIFRQGIPVIAVSNALLSDIANFSGAHFKGYVVPNVVDSQVFALAEERRKERFFMASHWKAPKMPLVALEAFKLFIKAYPHFELVVGGYGPDTDKIRNWIDDNGVSDRIILLGALEPEEMADQFRSSVAFLHCSDYETFSVVCAEALCCGTPVIASRVGGIAEFVDSTNGFLVNENSAAAWFNAMNEFMGRYSSFNAPIISQAACDRFSADRVGHLCFEALSDVSKWYNKSNDK